MPFKYEINGNVVEFDREPSEEDIDEAAASLKPPFQPGGGSTRGSGATGSYPPISMAEANQQQRIAQINAQPLSVLAKGLDNATRPAINASLFGLPDIISQKMTGQSYIDADSKMQGLSSLFGLVEGGPSILAKGAGKLVKGSGLLSKIGRGAVEGSTAAGTLLPSPEEAPTMKEALSKEAQHIGAGAVLGGALPVVGAGLSAAGTGIKKGIDYIGKSAADYVTTKVAPRAYQVYQDAVNKFTPQIQKFAEEKLNIPKSAIETIKQNGVQKIQQVRQTLGDTTDAIVQRLNGQIQDFRTAADYAYKKVFQSAPTGQVINIKPSIDQAGNILKKLRLITANGNPTQFGESEIARDSVYGKLLDFYKSSKAISGVENIDSRTQNLTQGQMIKSVMSKRETLVNKEQFQLLRDKLNSLYKGKSSDVAVGKVVNQFYTDGESSGLSGLQKARELQRKAYDIEDNYAKLVKQGSFDKFHSLPEEQIRQLKELQGRLGIPFIEDLKALSAGKYLDKLAEYNPERFAKDFNTANDPKWTKTIYEEYKSLLGESHAKKIFDEIVAHRRGMKIKGGIMTGVGVGTAGAIGTGIVNKITGH